MKLVVKKEKLEGEEYDEHKVSCVE